MASLKILACVLLVIVSCQTTWGLHDEGPGFETEGLIPPLRSIVAVQGIVYCKPCRFQGIPTLLGASPLSGAVVRLQCDSIRTPTTVYATTDKNGYFFAQAPTNVTSFGANSCRAYLVSSPLATCQKPTDLNWGLTGAPLRFERWLGGPLWFAIYTVGPFAFEPTNSTECPPR